MAEQWNSSWMKDHGQEKYPKIYSEENVQYKIKTNAMKQKHTYVK